MALLPAAVLIGDPAQQWLSDAIPIVLQQDLATSEALVASFLPNSSAAYQVDSSQVLRAVVEERAGRFRIQLTETAAATQQNTRVLQEEGPVSGGVIPVLNALAKKLDSARASPFSTHSEQALRSFSAAVSAPEAASRNQLLDASVQADPSFGLGQIARVENAPQAFKANAIASNTFVPLDQARWDALSARLQHAPLDQQATAEAAVVRLAPNNVEALAALGSDRFLAGNGSEGERLLRRAISLNPSNPALSLQLAQGLVAVRKFDGAARILSALSGNSVNLLPSLALVQLLAGDTKGADQTFKRFLSFLPAGNPAIPALEAQWQRFTSPDPQASPAQSIEVWQSIVNQSGNTNLAARAMLAAALDHAGKSQKAGSVKVLPFIPEFTDPNAPVAFNEMRRRTESNTKQAIRSR